MAHNYTAADIAAAEAAESRGTFTLSGVTVRCSKCRFACELLVSELLPDGKKPRGYICAECSQSNYDPREPETRS